MTHKYEPIFVHKWDVTHFKLAKSTTESDESTIYLFFC